MRDKIVLRRRPVSVAVNLHNGISFVSRYERVSRTQLPGNIRVTRARTIGPRQKIKNKEKSKVQLGQHASAGIRIRKEYGNLSRRQTGKGLASSLANLGLNMCSKAINSVIGKKIIDKGM